MDQIRDKGLDMNEYFRSESHTGASFSWTDDYELCMVLDTVTGEPERAFSGGNSIGTFSEAKQYTMNKTGWEKRTVIVRLNAISAHQMI